MNCRPLPYQGSALPLSYGSGDRGAVGQRNGTEAGGTCHKGCRCARIPAATPMPHIEPDPEVRFTKPLRAAIPHSTDKFAGGTKKFPAPAADRIRKFAYNVLELRGEFRPAVAGRAADLKKIPATFPAGRELEDQARCGFGSCVTPRILESVSRAQDECATPLAAAGRQEYHGP